MRGPAKRVVGNVSDAPQKCRACECVVDEGHQVIGPCKVHHSLKVRDIATWIAQRLHIDHLRAFQLRQDAGLVRLADEL